MNNYKIKLDIADVMEFNRVANSLTKPVTLYQGERKVNGKSLLGIYTFDLCNPIFINIDSKHESEIINTKFSKWLVVE